MLVLDSDFRKQGEGKVDYYSMHVFGGFRLKTTVWREDASAFPDSGDSQPSSNVMSSCGWWLSFSLLVRDEASAL